MATVKSFMGLQSVSLDGKNITVSEENIEIRTAGSVEARANSDGSVGREFKPQTPYIKFTAIIGDGESLESVIDISKTYTVIARMKDGTSYTLANGFVTGELVLKSNGELAVTFEGASMVEG